MNTSFRAVCEAAAERWRVPALVVGTGRGTVALGCDPGTRFRIASITKPLTAALALLFLDPEEPTGVWPEDVRLRHLLSHMSGFDCELPDGDNAKYGSGDDALGRCVADLPHVRRFVGSDRVWSYANTGFWLAGLLAAERAGATFEDALAAHVLHPAGAEATDFGEPDIRGTGAAAREGYPRSRRPSGGLVSTVPDLLRLGSWLLAHGEAQRIVAATAVDGVYGLGIFGERAGGVEVWGHGGSAYGFESSLLFVPSHGAVFAGLTNASNGGRALAEIENAWLEEVVGARRPEPHYLHAEPGELEAFAGTYENSSTRYVVEPAADALVVRSDGEELVGRKVAERTFQVATGEYVNERFDFPLDGFIRFGVLAARVG